MIDWYLAERLAGLVAGRGDAPAPRADLAALAADAERRVARYTGLTPTRPLPAPEGIDRREWVRANIASMRRLLDPVLAGAERRLAVAARPAGPGQAVLRPVVSLGVSAAVTLEVGVVLGYLAQRVLGQYELVLLDEVTPDVPPRLLFVLPNLGSAVRSLHAPEGEFLTWVTLHEVTHAVQFSGVPWLQGHLAGLVSELMAGAELRMDGGGRGRSGWGRLPSRAELRRTLSAVRRGDIIGIFASPGERATIDSVQATMAVVEGHAEHVMDAVAPDLLPSLPRLRAALDRRRSSQTGISRLLGKLLGLDLKLRQYESGKAFCDAIAAAAGPEALTRLFDGPETLPSLAEVSRPEAWLARMGLGRAAVAAE